MPSSGVQEGPGMLVKCGQPSLIQTLRDIFQSLYQNCLNPSWVYFVLVITLYHAQEFALG